MTSRLAGPLFAGLEEPLISRDCEHGIPADHPTLPRDCATPHALFGKWHCGGLPWFSPLRNERLRVRETAG